MTLDNHMVSEQESADRKDKCHHRNEQEVYKCELSGSKCDGFDNTCDTGKGATPCHNAKLVKVVCLDCGVEVEEYALYEKNVGKTHDRWHEEF